MKHTLQIAARSDRVLQAIGLMCLYVSLIVFVNAGGKVLSATAHPFQIVFFRHGGAAVFMTTAFLLRYGWPVLAARRPGLQMVRGVFAIASSFLYFTALVSTSLATAAAISFTAPLVVTALSAPLLKERVGPYLWAAVAVGFAGALIIVRPGTGDASNRGAAMLVGSACCTAIYQIVTRMLAGQDRAETTTIWTTCVSGTVATLAVLWIWKTPPSAGLWALSLAMGLIGGTGHFLLAKAFERGPASLLAPFNYLQLVGATVIGFGLYGDLPDNITWIGAAAIVAAGLYIAWRERRGR